LTETVTTVDQRANVEIQEELCKACELCVVSCPSGNLRISAKLNHAGFHPVEFSYQGSKGVCTGCAICYWVCPDFAISEVQVRT
jgi:2-oxoglutarate ferredoxin oxidoreductase subunit delta